MKVKILSGNFQIIFFEIKKRVFLPPQFDDIEVKIFCFINLVRSISKATKNLYSYLKKHIPLEFCNVYILFERLLFYSKCKKI